MPLVQKFFIIQRVFKGGILSAADAGTIIARHNAVEINSVGELLRIMGNR